jgi:hypothetical protein
MKWQRGVAALGGLLSVFVLTAHPLAYAAQTQSTNYSVDEVFMGAGGELNACSANYCSKQSAGEVAAGNAAATAFRTQAGFNTDREPYLAFSVASSSTDLGTLSTLGTATTTGTFAVKTYLSNGYVITTASDAPTSNGLQHIMSSPSSPTASAIGTEQFGINLVANTTAGPCNAPANFGANPVQVPDNTFSFGDVDPDYAQCGKFMYLKDDVIASSTRSTGETDFTISFIYNISPLTSNGEYTYNGVFVATSTY